MSTVANFFRSVGIETDPVEKLIKAKNPKKQAAFRSVFNRQSEPRRHPELQNETALLHVTHKDNDKATTVLDQYVDMKIVDMPDNAKYAGHEVLSGPVQLDWFTYALELTGDPETSQVSKQCFNMVLKDGTQRHLEL